MNAAAPAFRSICQITGEKAERPSKFFYALDNADQRVGELDAIREAFAAAVGCYDCPCGSAFEFDTDSTLEDYAALNRWLGRHGECQIGSPPSPAEIEQLRAETTQLRAQEDASAEAIGTLLFERDRARRELQQLRSDRRRGW